MKDIKILGTGCAKCKRLERVVTEIRDRHGIEANIEKVEDINRIIEYGVMATPAIVVEGEVKAVGRIPNEREIRHWLEE